MTYRVTFYEYVDKMDTPVDQWTDDFDTESDAYAEVEAIESQNKARTGVGYYFIGEVSKVE